MTANTTFPEPPFYLVWCEGGGAPRFKHGDPMDAEQEASRLAKENPGRSFVVLAPVVRITAQSVTVERFDPDAYIPF